MKKKLFLSCFWVAPFLVKGQFARSSASFAYAGPFACSRFQPNTLSTTVNPAALARITQSSMVIYGERKFNFPELSSVHALLGLVTGSGNRFGLSAHHSGFSSYNESQAVMGYGRPLGNKADIGIQFNYHSIRIGNGYGNASAITADAGILLHLSEKLHTGFYCRNPVGGKFGKESGEKIPLVVGFGWGYDVSENFFIGASVEQEEKQPVRPEIGLQYRFVPQAWARIGIGAATGEGWIGLGYQLKKFGVEINAAYHPYLGFSPGLLLQFQFSHKEKE